MARTTLKLPTVANVSAGSTATLKIPVRPTYNMIKFAYSGTAITRAMFKNIRLNVNSKPMLEYKNADRLQFINSYYNRADNAGFFTLHFDRKELHNLTERRITGLGTMDMGTLDITMEIDGAAPGDLKLEAHAIVSEPMPMGAIVKVKTFPYDSSTSGAKEISDIPKVAPIMAVHFFKADVSRVEVETDRYKWTEADKTLLEDIQKHYERVPQSAVATHVDYLLEGQLAQALVAAGSQDFRLRPTIDTSGSMDIVVEYLDGFSGI